MKNLYLKTILIALLAVGFSACNESYFDVNTPSGAVQPEQLTMDDLLAPVIHSTMTGQRSAELVFGNYVQNFVSQGGGAAGETEASGLWSQVYLYVLPNVLEIKKKAEENGATHFDAVADILMAINLGIAADTWDNVPYSEATKGDENLFPKFDTQEEVYNAILGLLDKAITNLTISDQSGFKIGGDLIYRGDSEKWLRAAYTLKARFLLRLVRKGKATPADVIAAVSNGFTSNDDNFLMYFNEKNINPWYSSEVLAQKTGNFNRDIASQLVSSMNGDYYPFMGGVLQIDPRLPVFATNGGASEWKGFVSGGGGKAPDGTDANTDFVEDGYYTSIDSPLSLITYAEALFIKAEAEFLAAGGSPTSVGSTPEAYNAYMEGIKASFDQFGVSYSDYIADPAIDVGESNLMLHHIMKEKYIANFLNPETFVDYRRYDFSDQVFKGLKIREEDDSDNSDYKGQWFRRANYPTSELNRNRENVEQNQKTPVTPVWWDE